MGGDVTCDCDAGMFLKNKLIFKFVIRDYTFIVLNQVTRGKDAMFVALAFLANQQLLDKNATLVIVTEMLI